MTKFQKCEQEGRDKFSEFCILHGWDTVIFSDDEWDPADVDVTHGDKDYIVEIKDRRLSKDRWPSSLMEEGKRVALLRQVEEWGLDRAFYICFYDDGYYRMWDVADAAAQPLEVRSCPETTCGRKRYVKKDVRMMPHDYKVVAEGWL